ncbi:NrdH-redoxin [bacterium]|nr:NrdH-redoxin [bacterium]
MLTLYMKTGCPFCNRVLAVVDRLGLEDVELKDIADDAIATELVEKGGKRMVPYLVDGETAMYESEDIVNYLQETYGVKSEGGAAKPRVHVGGSTCVSCEG